MPASIGVNLRVTGHCSQGGRKYMEDFFSVAYQQSSDEKDLEYAFIGIYDGHGGSEAATFAKEHLINWIVNQKQFWSESDDDILRAIREGYIATHYAMLGEQDKWPKTATGLPSTAGTTASIAFIRHGKIYIGHAGDSGIVLGCTDDNDRTWRAKPLTQDHKPECHVEKARIINSGGKVAIKSGVSRVVWNRPRLGHKGPVRRSTPIDEIPFLAVARSLGDLWSYNSALNLFVVSPVPDVRVVKIDPKKFRCLIFGTDGLWNVLSPNSAVEIVRYAEQMNDRNAFMEWINPSKCLVDKALERWSTTKMRADNTSVVIIMLDPPGPPKREVLRANSFLIDNDNNSNNATTSSSATIDVTQLAPGHHETISKNFTMYDHATKKIVDLNAISGGECISMSSSSSPSSSSSSPEGAEATTLSDNCFDTNLYKAVDYAADGITPSTSGLSSYMNSFAESYNSLLNSNYDVDHNSYTSPSTSPSCSYQTAHHPYNTDSNVANIEDTYSLTKLATRTEQQEEGYVAVTACNATFFDEDETRACIFGINNTYPQHHTSMDIDNDDDNQYDSITSSHLSAACEVYENLDCSAQANISGDLQNSSTMLMNINDLIFDDNPSKLSSETDVILPNCDLYSLTSMPNVDDKLDEPESEPPDQSVPVSMVQSVVVSDFKNDEPVSASSEIVSPLDESIQIHEISSSSKENDTKSSSCESKENKTNDDHQSKRTSSKLTTSSRVTRSKQQKTMEIPAITNKRPTKTNRCIQQRRHTNIVQNENIGNCTRTSSRRRITQIDTIAATTQISPIVIDIDRSQKYHSIERTLRSKNVINKNVSSITSNNKKLSSSNTCSSSLLLTSKSKFKGVPQPQQNVLTTKSKSTTPKVQALIASTSETIVAPPVVTRWLREKIKPTEKLLQLQRQQSIINSTKQKPSSSFVLSSTSVLRRTSSCITNSIAGPPTTATLIATTTTTGKSIRIKNQQTRRK